MLPGLPQRVGDNAHHFTGRTWLLPWVLDWLSDGEERVLLLTGGPGTGKSMIAAWLGGEGPLPDDGDDRTRLQRVREQGGAVPFCQGPPRGRHPPPPTAGVAGAGGGGAFLSGRHRRGRPEGAGRQRGATAGGEGGA